MARDGNFIDFLKIRVRAGRGGDGVASFERSSRIPRGRPSGGDGGPGGSVIFVPDPSLDSLNHLDKFICAEAGLRGGKNCKEGAAGRNTVIRVPLGSEIRESESVKDRIGYKDEQGEEDGEYADDFVLVDEERSNERIIEAAEEESQGPLEEIDGEKPKAGTFKFEIDPDPKRPLPCTIFEKTTDLALVVARGGRGGRGNASYGNNNHECEKGQMGEERIIEIDLKTIADIGLVGQPNAGKSSFLAAVSNAHPKIASYPFTTLNPYVGIIEYSDGERISLADIPGLIKDAHQNRGLGHNFLKHIVKSRILSLVVDFAKPDPALDIATLLQELDLYQEGLAGRCRLVIANKADLLDSSSLRSQIDNCRNVFPQLEFLPVSALHALAITKVTERMRQLVKDQN